MFNPTERVVKTKQKECNSDFSLTENEKSDYVFISNKIEHRNKIR